MAIYYSQNYFQNIQAHNWTDRVKSPSPGQNLNWEPGDANQECYYDYGFLDVTPSSLIDK
jgi:hypothetical protein